MDILKKDTPQNYFEMMHATMILDWIIPASLNIESKQ